MFFRYSLNVSYLHGLVLLSYKYCCCGLPLGGENHLTYLLLWLFGLMSVSVKGVFVSAAIYNQNGGYWFIYDGTLVLLKQQSAIDGRSLQLYLKTSTVLSISWFLFFENFCQWEHVLCGSELLLLLTNLTVMFLRVFFPGVWIKIKW